MTQSPTMPRPTSKGRRAPKASIGHTPTPAEIGAVKLLLEPWHWLTAPQFRGVQNVPAQRPFLLVGNHTLMGVLDVPLLVLGLHERRGVFVRSLADHLHFRVPLWRDLLTRFGAVDGTPETCRALMRAGESILVFPGGGREVFKHKGEKYHLIWKNRIGFVRLALESGYPIVPFAAVGAEECYEILIDNEELRRTALGKLIERFAPRPSEIPPVVRGLGPLPRPQRFYFSFGKAIETENLKGQQDDEAVCLAVRAKVQCAVNRGLARLLAARRIDPQRDLATRLLERLKAAAV